MNISQNSTSSKRKIPAYLAGRLPIIGRYHGVGFQKTQQAAKAFSELGLDTYPSFSPKCSQLVSGSGDIFNFLGGDKLVDPPHLTQLGFFRLLREKKNRDVRKAFCYAVIQNGYLGRTASIEVGYVMALKTHLIFSELPTTFSSEVPNSIVSIIKENCTKYPLLPVEKISTGLSLARERPIEFPLLTKVQQWEIYLGILGLQRDLRKKFGFKLASQTENRAEN